MTRTVEDARREWPARFRARVRLMQRLMYGGCVGSADTITMTHGSANRVSPTGSDVVTIDEPSEHGRGLVRSVEEP